MAAYRPLGQFNQYFLSDGAVNNGGSITFYATDLTTLKDTYSDIGLTVVNTNPVVLDSSGRLSTDVWGSGDYGAVIKDRSGTVIETRNNIQSGSGATSTIPTLVTSEFLTNNGSNLIWQAITQVPDPTGYAGDVLYSDGTVSYWAALPATSANVPVVTTTSVKMGTILMQWGSDTIAPSGAYTANKAFTFGTAFSAIYHVEAVYNGASGVTATGGIPVLSVGSRSVTGATAYADMNAFGNIINSIPFTWFAIGAA